MEQILSQLAQVLYGEPRLSADLAVTEIRAAMGGVEPMYVESAIRLMDRRGLLDLGLGGNAVSLTRAGKLAFERKSAPEICLGRQFIIHKYRRAVKHVVVRDPEGNESGGSGFFCADFAGWLATARHLIEGHEVLRIENEDGSVLSAGPFELRLAADDLDLALIRADLPVGVVPFRVEWDAAAVSELDPVLVMGYPPIALHRLALVFSEGQVASLAKKRGGNRVSTIISKITEPGFSGGPVLNDNGFVIAVMEQENIFRRNDGAQSIFNGATPSHYFAELMALIGH